MSRNYKLETEKRVEFIRKTLTDAGVKKIVFGNSGGKDSALVGILCKLACDSTVGIILPCGVGRSYGEDMSDALAVADQYGIKSRTIDLGKVSQEMRLALGEAGALTDTAATNIAPRLRMTALYAVAASENALVAGTGNRSERHMGYFTKWGDGAFDFNPIGDLTATEVFEFLEHLKAPRRILEKAPSAGLFDGQTDEDEMGVTYKAIDEFLIHGTCCPEDAEIIGRYHRSSEHKRRLPMVYTEE